MSNVDDLMERIISDRAAHLAEFARSEAAAQETHFQEHGRELFDTAEWPVAAHRAMHTGRKVRLPGGLRKGGDVVNPTMPEPSPLGPLDSIIRVTFRDPRPCDVCILLRNQLVKSSERVADWHLCRSHWRQHVKAHRRPLRASRGG